MNMARTHTKSEEHKQKLRDAAKRRYANPQERQRQSERMVQAYKDNSALRKMHEPDASDKRSRTLKHKWSTTEYRKDMITRRNTPETRAKLSAAAQQQWNTSRDTLVSAIQAARSRHIDIEKLYDRDWLIQTNEHTTLTDMAEMVGCSQSRMSRQFAEFGIVPKQHPVAYTGGETQIVEFLHSLGIAQIIQRDRGCIPPMEIDVYIPDAKLGIEYHGCFWHSYNTVETVEQRRRHVKKYMAAKSQNIRLLQFWDTEWFQHPTICQNIIRGALHRNNTIGARQCTIGTPTYTEMSAFLSAHHLQGSCPYTEGRGLYKENELVMVMTIGKSRFTPGSWELLRLATKTGYHISGGASKLWSSLVSCIPSAGVVYSYANMRLFTGAVYTSLGFTHHHDTSPGYQYWRDGQLYSRLAFQKHKLSVLPGYDAALTEAENMFQLGYRRLWDAGQSVWVYQQP